MVSSTLPPIPDRPHDLEAYNYGNAPPPVFWHIHPAFESDWADVFDLKRALAKREGTGMPGPKQVAKQFARWRKCLT